MGRAGVRFRPIAESRSRWRGVRRRDRGWDCWNTSAIHEESRGGVIFQLIEINSL